MFGGKSYLLIASFVVLGAFALPDHWGVPGPDDIPTKFTLVAAWNSKLGSQIKDDCESIIAGWPRSGAIQAVDDLFVMYSGACALGLYVQHPRRSGPTTVQDQWARITYTTSVAINLHVGTVRAGWSIDFPSGLQVCFFFNIHQFTNFNQFKSLSWNLDRSPFFQRRGDANVFPQLVPMTDTQQWHSDLQSRLVAEGYPLGLADMAEPFSGLGAGSWASTRPITADCEAAISHLAIESWFISRTGVTLLAPKLETDGHCTLGIYLTSPLDPETGDIRPYGRAQGSDINIVHEATKLVSKIEIQQEGGAYVDLQNGLELCLYDQSLIDPTNICARMTKMRLRDCLDNRAAASRGRMVMAAGSRIATTNTGMTSTVASTLAATTPAIARSPQILPGH